MTKRTFSRAAVATLLLVASFNCEDQSKSKMAMKKPAMMPPEVTSKTQPDASTGFQKRHGDEIVVCGHFYRIGAPVVTWMDAGGYDAYRTERRFAPYEQSSWGATTRIAATQPKLDLPDSPERYNLRFARTATSHYSPQELEQIRGGGWTLEQLQKEVDQFVIHYDVAGTSKICFKVLHDIRGLSVQFMLDIDGTIYQTMDLKERAFQATKANDRSVGIEIANMGAYSASGESIKPLEEWYKKDAAGQTYISIPPRLGPDAIRTKGVTFHPARNDLITGSIQGHTYRQYDLTPQQYDSLIKLTAALCDIFPELKCDAPRGPDGKVTTVAIPNDQYPNYKGVLGHYHVQTNKQDPGPAFQWDYVLDSANQLLAARKARVSGAPEAPLPPTSASVKVSNLPSTMPARK